MRLFFGIILFISFMVACSNSEQQIRERAKESADSLISELNLKKDIIGEWETVSFHVDVNSFNNTDSSYSVIVGKGQWEEKLGMKPIVTKFSENNVYIMNFYDTQDSVIDSKKGLWSVFGDTLMMMEPDATYQYHVMTKNEHIQFQALLDWDGDGVEDDEYRRIESKRK